jgi:hypothetical protein
MFSNPVIGRIKSIPHNFKRNPPFIRNPHPGVGYQYNLKAISAGDTVNLLFDRTRVSIDKNIQQPELLDIPRPATSPPIHPGQGLDTSSAGNDMINYENI